MEKNRAVQNLFIIWGANENKIQNHHLRFRQLVFIPHTMMATMMMTTMMMTTMMMTIKTMTLPIWPEQLIYQQEQRQESFEESPVIGIIIIVTIIHIMIIDHCDSNNQSSLLAAWKWSPAASFW